MSSCKENCCCDCIHQADGINELCSLGKLGCGNTKEACLDHDDTCDSFEKKGGKG